jgi:hypothetical protein
MADSLESIQYQYDRANMIVSTQQTVEWAKTGIKMGSGLLETVVKKFGLSIVDGFSNNLCKDMNKFNQPLTKMYRKYWRRGSSSPETELGMIVFGALAMTVMGNKGLMGGPKASEPFTRPQVPQVPQASQPAQPSALRPPNSAKMPDWARAALEAEGPEKPQHFASREELRSDLRELKEPKAELGEAKVDSKVADPELAPNVPVTFLPRPKQEEVVVVRQETDSKKVILGSPKTSRKRVVADEIVFS